MKDMNFSNLKNIAVPEEWVKKALDIPKTYAEKKEKKLFSLPKILVAVACLVLVCALSLPLYLFNQQGIELPVLPSEVETEVTSDYSEESRTTSVSSYGDRETVSTDPSEKPSAESESDKTDPVESTSQSDNPQNQKPAETSPSSTDPPETTPGNPSIQGPTTPPSTELYPGAPPMTGDPSMTDAPTDTPIVTEAPCFPPEVEAPPTEPTVSAESVVSFTAIITDIYAVSDEITADGFYCKLEDSNGNLIGDPNLYSQQHRVTDIFYLANGFVLSYTPSYRGLDISPGTYYAIFYDAGGFVLYEDTVRV